MRVPDQRRFLWILLLLSLLGYALLPIRFPLLPDYNDLPLSDVRTFAPSLLHGLGYALHFLFLYGLYVIAWRVARRAGAARAFVLLAPLLLALPLLLTYPINATDVFRYFVRGRVLAVHGESSLSVPPSAFPEDPFSPLAGQWGDETSPYGPLWELLAAGVTVISGQNLLVSLFIFKLLGLFAHLGSGFLLWQSLSKEPPGRRAGRTLLWTWNPALLYMFVVDAHNDALMLFWLILGYWLMVRHRHPAAGMLVAFLSPLTKLIGLLPLPFFFLEQWRQMPSRSQQLRFLVTSALGGAALTALLFFPFGSPLALILRLVQEASGSAGFSPGVLLVLAAQRIDFRLTTAPVSAAGMVLLLAVAVILLWLTWQGRSALRSAADITGAYLLTALTYRLWYSIWPLPWLLLDSRSGRRLHAVLWFLLTTQLSVVIYGHVRVHLLQGDQFMAHLLGVPFTFLLPLLLAYAVPHTLRSDKRQRGTQDY
ncbi:MAG: hypothetical protein ACOCXI_01775 [Chloroflexota bacterium]